MEMEFLDEDGMGAEEVGIKGRAAVLGGGEV